MRRVAVTGYPRAHTRRWEEDDDDDDDERIGIDLEDAALGFGIEIGTRTLFGPVSLIIGLPATDLSPRVGINLGFEF